MPTHHEEEIMLRIFKPHALPAANTRLKNIKRRAKLCYRFDPRPTQPMHIEIISSKNG
jgi:hypothetical protein